MRTKKANFLGYCFYMNKNIYGNFQICISVPLIKKLWLILKFRTAQTERQIITINISLNISRNKGHQTIKFGQLIECNIFFLKNHTQNAMEKLVPDPFIRSFYKNSKLAISVDQQSEML